VRARFSVVAVLSLVVSGSASAQLPNFPQFDLDHLEVNSSAMGSLVVGTGEILPVGAARFSLAGDYQNNPYQYIDPTGAVSSIISDRYTVHVVGGFAPMDWLEVGLDLPVVAAQSPGEGIEVALPGVGVVSRALGSPTLSARGALMFQSKGAPFDMAFQLGAKIPIGSSSAFVSDGKIGLSPKLMFGRNLEWARAGLEVGALWRPNNATVSSSGDPLLDTVGSSLLLAGVLSGGPQNGLRGEISGRTYVTLGGKVGSVELLLGARYPIAQNMEIYALAGPGLGEAAGTPKWRVMVGAAFGNGQGIAGTPLPGGGALAPMPGTAGAPEQPGTAPGPTPAETQPQPSNPFPPFTPPPGMYPPQPAPTYPPDQTYPQPQPQPAYPQPAPAPAPTYPSDTAYPPQPPPPPAPTYTTPPPPSQPAPPPPEPAPGYNTYPTDG
jgi:OmpA-OmpF porin, OOP family